MNQSSLVLGGVFNTADVGTVIRTGGNVYLTGTLTNTGTALNLDDATGPWHLSGGTIVVDGEPID